MFGDNLAFVLLEQGTGGGRGGPGGHQGLLLDQARGGRGGGGSKRTENFKEN